MKPNTFDYIFRQKYQNKYTPTFSWGGSTNPSFSPMGQYPTIPVGTEYDFGGYLSSGLSGAASGAMTGFAVGAPAGGIAALPASIIGGTIGLVGGLFGEAKREKQQEEMLASQTPQPQSYMLPSAPNQPTFSDGGPYIPPTYGKGGQAFDGTKLVLSPNYQYPKRFAFGGNDMMEFKGPKHTGGGININGKYEVEGGETQVHFNDGGEAQDGSSDYIFSEQLGFAKKSKKYLPQDEDDSILRRAKKQNLENLKQEQELVRNTMEQKTIQKSLGGNAGVDWYAKGGKIPKGKLHKAAMKKQVQAAEMQQMIQQMIAAKQGQNHKQQMSNGGYPDVINNRGNTEASSMPEYGCGGKYGVGGVPMYYPMGGVVRYARNGGTVPKFGGFSTDGMNPRTEQGMQPGMMDYMNNMYDNNQYYGGNTNDNNNYANTVPGTAYTSSTPTIKPQNNIGFGDIAKYAAPVYNTLFSAGLVNKIPKQQPYMNPYSAQAISAMQKAVDYPIDDQLAGNRRSENRDRELARQSGGSQVDYFNMASVAGARAAEDRGKIYGEHQRQQTQAYANLGQMYGNLGAQDVASREQARKYNWDAIQARQRGAATAATQVGDIAQTNEQNKYRKAMAAANLLDSMKGMDKNQIEQMKALFKSVGIDTTQYFG